VDTLKKLFPGVAAKYSGAPRIDPKEFRRIGKFTEKDFVFLCDCTDLFGSWVSSEFIMGVLDAVRGSSAKFLLLTKNPARYVDLAMQNMDVFPENVVLGCTVESDLYHGVSKALRPLERLDDMAMLADLVDNRLFFSVEPVLKFSEGFFDLLTRRKRELWGVAVGYDNCHKKLPEPRLADTERLIADLEAAGVTVYRKSLREAWDA
jgi:protein gp37